MHARDFDLKLKKVVHTFQILTLLKAYYNLFSPRHIDRFPCFMFHMSLVLMSHKSWIKESIAYSLHAIGSTLICACLPCYFLWKFHSGKLVVCFYSLVTEAIFQVNLYFYTVSLVDTYIDSKSLTH